VSAVGRLGQPRAVGNARPAYPVAAYHPVPISVSGLQAGRQTPREAEEILRAVDGAREVARELLARIVDSLNQILLQ